jgi:hypothetical protein
VDRGLEAEAEMNMSDLFKHGFELPPKQQAIRAKCFYLEASLVEFTKEEVGHRSQAHLRRDCYNDRTGLPSKRIVMKRTTMTLKQLLVIGAVPAKTGRENRIHSLSFEKDTPLAEIGAKWTKIS